MDDGMRKSSTERKRLYRAKGRKHCSRNDRGHSEESGAKRSSVLKGLDTLYRSQNSTQKQLPRSGTKRICCCVFTTQYRSCFDHDIPSTTPCCRGWPLKSGPERLSATFGQDLGIAVLRDCVHHYHPATLCSTVQESNELCSREKQSS